MSFVHDTNGVARGNNASAWVAGAGRESRWAGELSFQRISRVHVMAFWWGVKLFPRPP